MDASLCSNKRGPDKHGSNKLAVSYRRKSAATPISEIAGFLPTPGFRQYRRYLDLPDEAGLPALSDAPGTANICPG
jgi:hypothetical protein